MCGGCGSGVALRVPDAVQLQVVRTQQRRDRHLGVKRGEAVGD